MQVHHFSVFLFVIVSLSFYLQVVPVVAKALSSNKSAFTRVMGFLNMSDQS